MFGPAAPGIEPGGMPGEPGAGVNGKTRGTMLGGYGGGEVVAPVVGGGAIVVWVPLAVPVVAADGAAVVVLR